MKYTYTYTLYSYAKYVVLLIVPESILLPYWNWAPMLLTARPKFFSTWQV